MKIKTHYIFKTILVLIALAFIGLLFTKHEKIDDPKTRGISLDIERSAVSVKLKQFVLKDYSDKKEINELYAVDPSELRTPKTQKRLKDLFSVHDSFLKTSLDAITDPGCLPQENPIDLSKTFVHYYPGNLLTASKLIALQALVDSVEDNPNLGAQKLTTLIHHIVRLEQTCVNSLISEIILIHTLKHIYSFSVYPLSHPKLTKESRDLLIQALREAGDLSSKGLANMWRLEYQISFSNDLIEDSVQKDFGVSAKWMWPLLDVHQMREWIMDDFRSKVWKASQPFAPREKLRTRTDDFFDELLSDRWYGSFRYNTIAIILLSIIHSDGYKYYTQWHSHKCVAKLYLTHIITSLSLEDEVPINPLTQKPFDLPSKTSCDITESPKKRTSSLSPWPTWP